MSDRVVILSCPFCDWSAAYDPDDTERGERLTAEFRAHLKTHA